MVTAANANANTAGSQEDGRTHPSDIEAIYEKSSEASQDIKSKTSKWTLGILGDPETDEVPGSVLLLSKSSQHNAPLGLQNTPARTSSSSIPSIFPASIRSQAMFGRHAPIPEKKRTRNGKIILEPQPEDTMNDPLNWSALRRDAALFSLGFYCMVGGGMTPILAAGFTNVAATYDVTIPKVALTTGLYMMGLGVGSVIASPTAIAFGKRPVYLVASCMFVLTAVWCALSPTYTSLVIARVIQGIAVSPVECLPSASIAEIYFLHERAYRLGIYTLLLLGGKNLIPLISAAIIQSLGWRWVFWVVAMVVGFCGVLLFFFVPETFWDRTPVPHKSHRRPSFSGLRRFSSHLSPRSPGSGMHEREKLETWSSGLHEGHSPPPVDAVPTQSRQSKHARFASDAENESPSQLAVMPSIDATIAVGPSQSNLGAPAAGQFQTADLENSGRPAQLTTHNIDDYFTSHDISDPEAPRPLSPEDVVSLTEVASPVHYTKYYRSAPPKTYLQTLKPYSGRLSRDNWFKVAFRPFILFAYPAILWSSAVYALSVGWLIILSESVSTIYRSKTTYNFSAIQTGLIYISPFVGGILGTVVAGKISDYIVQFMSRKNGGIYEPEFRLVMAIPVAICTTIGLMGFGWSAQEHDAWIVPTIFFGIISFGCTLGSTTAITFAVDSYRQYAGEALVTMNWSKNVFDGLVFSLFFNSWLSDDGSKKVFLALGGIQLFFLLWTIPLYIFGKRARMWTVRRNLMEKF